MDNVLICNRKRDLTQGNAETSATHCHNQNSDRQTITVYRGDVSHGSTCSSARSDPSTCPLYISHAVLR